MKDYTTEELQAEITRRENVFSTLIDDNGNHFNRGTIGGDQYNKGIIKGSQYNLKTIESDQFNNVTIEGDIYFGKDFQLKGTIYKEVDGEWEEFELVKK